MENAARSNYSLALVSAPHCLDRPDGVLPNFESSPKSFSVAIEPSLPTSLKAETAVCRTRSSAEPLWPNKLVKLPLFSWHFPKWARPVAKEARQVNVGPFLSSIGTG
jgi:hypothetical protein